MIYASNSALRGSLNIKVENFRPNLLVTGGSGAPHQEDCWEKIFITPTQRPDSNQISAPKVTNAATSSTAAELELLVTGPCSRCSMVNVDGSSGSMDCRAFQALSTYRKDGSSVYFGQFCALPPNSLRSLDYQQIWLTVGSTVNTR